MNNFSKLMLSDEELQLANNADWILTKRIIIDKVNKRFGALSEELRFIIDVEKSWLPDAVVQSTPKIAKGENYLQLPYVLMDYPRCFDVENVFAVRTMFWWGNFFSMTLHLSGKYKKMFEEKIIKNIDGMRESFFICVHETAWHAHFEADNYLPLENLTFDKMKEIILQKQFVKLAIQFPLHQWNDTTDILGKTFKEIIEVLKD